MLKNTITIIILVFIIVFLFFRKYIIESVYNVNLTDGKTEFPMKNSILKGNFEYEKKDNKSLIGLIDKEEKDDIIVKAIKEIFKSDLNKIPNKIDIDVPFTAQAPFAEWDDPRQQDGCEEASFVMAWSWINNESLTKQKARDKILALSGFIERELGEFADTSAEDAVKIFKKYYNYDKIRVFSNLTVQKIKNELVAGNIILAPTDGTVLKNPYYTAPGPTRHMIVIRGFNDEKGEFITNDPGTWRGKSFGYAYDSVINAIINYGTGYHAPLINKRKVGIVVSKNRINKRAVATGTD